MHKFRVLVLSSPALSQVIVHLFRGRPDFEVGSISGLKNLGQADSRLPELIVANVKPMSTRICRAVATIKGEIEMPNFGGDSGTQKMPWNAKRVPDGPGPGKK